MAVSIRLARHGGKKKPFYRIMAADKDKPRDGRFLEQLGYYDPKPSPADVKLDMARYDYWVGVGAQPSRTVAGLAKKVRASQS
jgi:small subunit ribosomal protein S16